MGTIVVGVDGSAASQEALRFAFEEARVRSDRVKVVQAWSPPFYPRAPYGFTPDLVVSPTEEADVRGRIERNLAAIVDRLPRDGIEVEFDVVEGPAGRVLADLSAVADLLVVGARGHGGFAGLLLGSVADQVSHHARCPVAIVPAARGKEETT